MEAAVDYFYNVLKGLHVGTADPNSLDSIKIKIDNNYLLLNQISYISAISNNTLRIQPWEPEWLNNICKVLNDANLGVVDKSKEAVFLKIPPMSGDRRAQLIELAKKNSEQQKVVIRNLRRDARSECQDHHKEIEKLTKDCIAAIDTALRDKIEKLSYTYDFKKHK